MSRQPNCPPPSCPKVDKLISYMKDDLKDRIDAVEDLRSINADLREWGEWWKERAEEIEREKDEEIKALLEEIDELKNG